MLLCCEKLTMYLLVLCWLIVGNC